MTNSGKEKDVLEQLKAIFRYEVICILRDKKFFVILIISFAILSLDVFLPPIVNEFETDPNFFLEHLNPNNLVIFLLAIGISMNSISGEFENETLELLASKPIDRDLIYLGKLTATFAILLLIYFFILIYNLGIVTWIYGPQRGLNLFLLAVPLLLTLSSMVWVSISFVLGSVSKSSVVVVIGTFGIFIGLSVTGGIVPYYSPESGEFLNYVPGRGESGMLTTELEDSPIEDLPINTGMDNVAEMFVSYTLDRDAEIVLVEHETGCPVTGLGPGNGWMPGERAYTIGGALGRSLSILFAYLIGLNYVGIFSFKRADILKR